MKDLGAKAFSYGYASPVLMAATYNDDDTVNVMNLLIIKILIYLNRNNNTMPRSALKRFGAKLLYG